LEAVLLLATAPLSTRKLATLADLEDATKARHLVDQLRRRLRRRGSCLQVVEVAGGVQLLTRPQLAPWLVRLHGVGTEVRLSPPALETLAVVAYCQPVVRAEIEAIRGVQCGELLRMLMERGFLRIVGRSDDLGRPMLYGTTQFFLQVFGLRRLEELPPIDQTFKAPSVAQEPEEPTEAYPLASQERC
jgi:segregation and condensation protein B